MCNNLHVEETPAQPAVLCNTTFYHRMEPSSTLGLRLNGSTPAGETLPPGGESFNGLWTFNSISPAFVTSGTQRKDFLGILLILV